MNRVKYGNLAQRICFRFMLSRRWLAQRPTLRAFDSSAESSARKIGSIYVINLDRQAHRWKRVKRELSLLYTDAKAPLIELTTRFSAFDAKYNREAPPSNEIDTGYLLSDQLFVEPDPFLIEERPNLDQAISMTREEIAVARSHIGVWRQIASSKSDYALVLEDDVYFRDDFPEVLDRAWPQLQAVFKAGTTFDMLYLSYREAGPNAEKVVVSDALFKPIRGFWQMSGYVLSRAGADKLLKLMPVRGPVDLWINYQFDKIDVFATSRSVIEQRLDAGSDNAYSVLPVLSRFGRLSDEKPHLFEVRELPCPVFAVGSEGTGAASLAMALSMLGYRCCSNVLDLPASEYNALLKKNGPRVFDAYVNIGSLDAELETLAAGYESAKFIVTVGVDDGSNGTMNRTNESHDEAPNENLSVRTINRLRRVGLVPERLLVAPNNERDKWKTLCRFLACERPDSKYPTVEEDQKPSSVEDSTLLGGMAFPNSRKLRFDSSPWIAPDYRKWKGLKIRDVSSSMRCVKPIAIADRMTKFDKENWKLLDDTFPNNLALFDAKNVSFDEHGSRIEFRKQSTSVREYTSGSVCSLQSYLYGQFEAAVRPANAAGLITGVFLHRFFPRQEIDIEFLGRDTTKILLNVYYNPGSEGAEFNFGYRGTPVLIDLGFDASKDFHRYKIEWAPAGIKWFVDGHLVHERTVWNPTPIPHLPMQFYFNLWATRSEELAGKVRASSLPAHSEINSIVLRAYSKP